MKINDGVLVDQKWAERVNVKCFGLPVEGASNPVHNLFYDVRPARLQTAWTQNAAGVWTATACFVVNDVADSSFTFPVFAPTATADPGGTAETTRFFVVWRGRWELIAGAGNQTFSTVSVVGSVSTSLATEQTQGGNYIPFIQNASANASGALVFTVVYLKLNQTVSTVNVLKSAQ